MTTDTVTRLEHDNKYSNKIGTRSLRPYFLNYDSFELFTAVVLETRLKKTEMTEHDCNTTATCCSRVQKSCMWECCLSVFSIKARQFKEAVSLEVGLL